MLLPPIPRTTIAHLIRNYDVLLLDAYGVLVDHSEALPGARSLVECLNREQKSYFIITNDATRRPATWRSTFQQRGLDISEECIITSGSLLKEYFLEHDLQGAPTFVVGAGDVPWYVEQAGGSLVPTSDANEIAALVVGGTRGFPLLDTLDSALTAVFRTVDQGKPVRLVLPNPDLIYPTARSSYGFTGGSIARMLEEAFQLRFPERKDLRFARLGKPDPRIFAAAAQLAGNRRMIMIGDQIDTDIAGAVNYGLDSALMSTGITPWHEARKAGVQPSFLLESLQL
ncbi:MAG: HAD-IA family hydrolase [Planctomycetota bacterium]